MKLAAIADVHLGNHNVFAGPRQGGLNGRALKVLQVLGSALRHVEELGVDSMAVAGDLFDTSRPPPAHIAAVQTLCGGLPYPLHVLCGNHDQTSSAEGDNAVAPLGPVATVHQRPSVEGPVFFVPFKNEPAEDYIRDALWHAEAEDALEGVEVLVVHAGVEDESTSPWLRGTHDSIRVDRLAAVLADYNLTCAITGNWHQQHVWRPGGGIEIAQVGALVPTGFDNPGVEGYGGLVVWDSSKPVGQRVEAVQLPGPRFVTAVDAERALLEAGDWPREQLYVQVRCPASAVPKRTAELDGLGLAGYRVVPSQAEAKLLAERAVDEAETAATQAEAISSWVRTMPDPGVPREAILAKVNELLASAQG